jgi:hypothetical protein
LAGCGREAAAFAALDGYGSTSLGFATSMDSIYWIRCISFDVSASMYQLDGSPFQHGLSQGAGIHMLEFSADWQAARDAADFDPTRAEHFADVVCRGFAFHGEIGSKDHFPDDTVSGAFEQTIQVNIARTDSVQRGQPTHQDEVLTAVGLGLLHHEKVGWCFHNA